MEKSLLLIDTHRFDEARTLLGEHLTRLPAAPTLLLSLARAQRQKARDEGRRLDPESESELGAQPRQLLALNRAFEPLVRLQEGRACLALSDGNVRRDHAASAFNRLRLWVNRQPKRDEAKEFEPWFGRQMVRHALAPIDLEEKVEAHHVDEIEALLEKNARIVDALEEDFGLRLTAS